MQTNDEMFGHDYSAKVESERDTWKQRALKAERERDELVMRLDSCHKGGLEWMRKSDALEEALREIAEARWDGDAFHVQSQVKAKQALAQLGESK